MAEGTSQEMVNNGPKSCNKGPTSYMLLSVHNGFGTLAAQWLGLHAFIAMLQVQSLVEKPSHKPHGTANR